MQIKYIDKIEDLEQARRWILSVDAVGFDIETTGLDSLKDKIRTMQFAVSPELSYVVDVQKLCDPAFYSFFIDVLASDQVVMTQNGKFDFQFLTRFINRGPLPVKNFYDTMIVSKLLSFDRYYELKQGKPHWFEKNRHSLGEIVRRELGIELDKSLQKSDFSGQLSQAQIEYAGRDAAILFSIRESQRKRVYEENLERVARLECNFVPCVADLELNGFYLDEEEWTVRTLQQKERADKLREQFLELVTPHVQVIDLFGEPVINVDSPGQLVPILQAAGVPVTTTKEDELRPFMSKYPEVQLLIDYREMSTALKKFGPDYLQFKSDVDGRIHADFQQITAPSGRMSCIAGGTLIQVPGGEKPIEQIVPGELVYCYSEEGKLTLRKVLDTFDQGVKECVEIRWQSNGTWDEGGLTCTPDHLLKSKERGWVQAKDLKEGEKLFHLRRSLQQTGDELRYKLYGANKLQEQEQIIIKREVFGKTGQKFHVHHKNEITYDNRISNLEVLSCKEHWAKHREVRIPICLENIKEALKNRGEQKKLKDSPQWIDLTRFQLLRMIAKTRGRLIYIPMDFNTFKQKCTLEGLDLKFIRSRYSKSGVYLSPSNILRAYSQERTVEATSLSLGIGTNRLKRLCLEYGLAYNHKVVSVQNVGTRKVYDLQVEEHQNFIAGEICVHNCWNPNLQQVPQDPEYRTPFKAQAGGKIITADYGQIELRIMARQSGDPQLVKVFSEGTSLHKHTCHTVLGEPLDHPDPHKYRIAKNLNFGATYGAGGERFAQVAGIPVDEAESVLKKFWGVYFVLDKFMQAQGTKCAHGNAKTFSGRKVRLNFDREDRRAYSSAVRLGRNFGVQGSSADILKRACYLMRNNAIQQDLDCRLVNLVHDEAVLETDDDSEIVSQLAESAMMEAGQEVLGEIPCTVDVKIGDTWLK